MNTETIEAALERIRAMLASSKVRQTTAPLLDEKSKSRRRRKWLDQVLALAIHPKHTPEAVSQIKALETVIYDYCMAYKEQGVGVGRRLVIYGENGSGKSHTAKAIARWAKRHAIDCRPVIRDSELALPQCEFHTWLRLLNDFKGGFKSGLYGEMFQQLCAADLLILDDVGADNDPNKFGVEQFYLLLEAREHRWTIITTNVEPASWENRFERRIASRLYRNTIHVPLDKVPDYNSMT